MPESPWRRFHDATLVDVVAEWSSGEARLRVRLSGPRSTIAEIRIGGLTLLRCPRAQPWGPSVSINEVRVAPIRPGRVRIEVEIQSGEVIELEGAEGQEA